MAGLALAVGLASAGAAAGAGCGFPSKRAVDSEAGAAGAAEVTARGGAPAGARQDFQELSILIVGGRFPAAQYNVRPGAVRLTVVARGGPYVLKIVPLLNAHRLPANATTVIPLTAPIPGEYLMELTGEGQSRGESALLNVRPVEGR